MPNLKKIETLLTEALEELQDEAKSSPGTVRDDPKHEVKDPALSKNDLPFIVLEIGHGDHPEGFEPGAVDPRTGTKEHDMNKVCAYSCREELASAGFHNVIVTDDGDYLRRIGEKFKKADIFVSVHHNAFSKDTAQGSETLVHRDYAREADKAFAKLATDEMATELGIANRGVKTMNLSVLKGATKTSDGDQCVVLVEPYFITGKDVDDHRVWSTKAGKALAKAIKKHLDQ